MKITKETVKEVIKEMMMEGKNNEEIEETFKDALRVKYIDIDVYMMAMETIYA